MSIQSLRREINDIDASLVELLNRRAAAAVRIGKIKRTRNRPAYSPTREKEVIDRTRRLNDGPLPNRSLQAIFREIMSASLALEQPLHIAYLGPEATFSHLAAHTRFGSGVEYLPCETIVDVFSALHKAAADFGVVPIENSIEGTVAVTLDQLVDTSRKICAEIMIPIVHNLMAKSSRSRIRRIYSHPQVLAQCRSWLQRSLPNAEQVAVTSSSRACELAAKEAGSAAIAGALAAERYRLPVREAAIQDFSDNYTRFLVLGAECDAPSGDDKTSILFSVKNRAGSLCETLQCMRNHRLNMTKIESRPWKSRVWEYYFFVDVQGHADEPRVARALHDIAEHCTFLRVLGSYPRDPSFTVA